MSISNILEYERRNPERLTQVERAEREATALAIQTGRYVTRGDGSIAVNKMFVAVHAQYILNNELG